MFLERLIEKKGFSLVELTITVAILFVVVAALYNMLDVGLTMHKNTNNHSLAQMEGRRNIERMVKDIRQAVSITETADNSLSFLYDYDKDNENETITYYYSSTHGKLYYSVGGVTKELGEFIVNAWDEPLFTFYNVSGDKLDAYAESTKSQTRSIMITMIEDYDKYEPPDKYVLINKVYLRNYD